jgi:hypothetical protein
VADALSHQKDDVADIVGLHALVSRMRLVSSLDVVEAAEQIILGIIATYQGQISPCTKCMSTSGRAA